MDVSPSGDSTVEVDQVTPPAYPITYTFGSGETVELKAVPAPGYVFNNWSGDLSGNANPTTIVMDCNKSITANFSQIEHTLTIQLNGMGSTTPAVGRYSYSEGAVVNITATPDSGWQFDSWTGDVAGPGSATTMLTMDSDKTITANFSKIPTFQIGWPLVGGIVGGLSVVGLLVTLLVVKRRAR